jgi:succinate dehydrogenase subunit D
MKQFLLRIDPLVWFLFGQGLLVGTILLTGWILVVGLAVPLGIVPAEALSFDRAYSLASSLVGRLVLLALIVTPIWKGAHHLRHFALDHGGYERDTAVATVLYAIATLGSVLGLIAVVRL